MKPEYAAAAAFLVALSSAVAQPPPPLKFEVASVKPAGPEHDGPTVRRYGPGTDDPERITLERVSLLSLLATAYNPPSGYDSLHHFDWDQISGPAWLSTEFYSVEAKVPPGTTKEQVKVMWQNLLAERFHLAVHFTSKDFSVYELTVAKGGPKLKQSGEVPPVQIPGFPVLAPGAHARSLTLPRTVRYTFRDYPISDFIQQLAWPLSEAASQVYSGAFTVAKVVDKTDLDGKYDFTFEFAGKIGPGGAFPPPLPDGVADTAPNLFDALRQQLGLQLEEKKMKLPVLVVDHADKVPTEN